ncbi:MAG: hypothetical protein LBQ27_01935, partial [Clostridiales bacterium]|nr:hypothetical protein [Clostridiales bacterium]
MKKQNKILIFILIAAFITVVMSGCVPKDNGSFAIKIDDEIRIYDSVADFPEIYLFNTKNGERVGNGFDDFWYSATNIYLQSGKIYVKNGAPAEFSDSLKITYKEDGSIYKLVTVKKMFVPLTEIELKSRDDKTACLAGESLKLFVEYFPENASEKNAVIRIEEGNAALTTDGTLTVGNDADGGEEIKLLAETPEGLTSRLTIFVKEKIVITTAEDFANIRRQPSEDYVLGNDIDFKNIGTGVTIPSFDGTFDGAGYTIFNLGIVISSTAFSQEQYFGLFNVCDGKIYNLKVENFSVTGQSSQSGTWIYAGGVVGLLTSNGIIENVRVTGTVNISRSASAAG